MSASILPTMMLGAPRDPDRGVLDIAYALQSGERSTITGENYVRRRGLNREGWPPRLLGGNYLERHLDHKRLVDTARAAGRQGDVVAEIGVRTGRSQACEWVGLVDWPGF